VLLHDEWCRRDIDKQYSHSETILQDVAYIAAVAEDFSETMV